MPKALVCPSFCWNKIVHSAWLSSETKKRRRGNCHQAFFMMKQKSYVIVFEAISGVVQRLLLKVSLISFDNLKREKVVLVVTFNFNPNPLTLSQWTLTNLSRSARLCSWKIPIACKSSWIVLPYDVEWKFLFECRTIRKTLPSPPRQFGPVWSGGWSDTICGPPILPTNDQQP